VKRLVKPLRLRTAAGADAARKVTWLELFFDLVFVAAVAQVAGPLRDDYSFAGIIRFTPLFILICWAWTGHAVFSTRFDTDDVVQRALTLVQMFAVAAMAANARDALDSRSSAGFAAAYAAVRFVLVTQYLRAHRLPAARPLARRYLVGHGVAALIWLGSALVPAPERFWLWGVALTIDLGTPWLAVPHSVAAPPDPSHLPERFGLFTLILLGESVVAVMEGMESQENWTAPAASAAFLGMAVLFLIWWCYFDLVQGAAERPVRTRAESLEYHVWSYAHFPLYFGIVLTGVGIKRIVSAATHSPIAASESTIMTGAALAVTVALAVIGLTARETAVRPIRGAIARLAHVRRAR
jgi:low temperature requirement protein LtrA